MEGAPLIDLPVSAPPAAYPPLARKLEHAAADVLYDPASAGDSQPKLALEHEGDAGAELNRVVRKTIFPPRFHAIEALRRLRNLPPGDPIVIAAQYQSRAQDAYHQAQWNERHGHRAAADVFYRAFLSDMARARRFLEDAVLGEEGADAAK